MLRPVRACVSLGTMVLKILEQAEQSVDPFRLKTKRAMAIFWVVFGLFILIGPYVLGLTIQYHALIGIGVAAFGALRIVALHGEGSWALQATYLSRFVPAAALAFLLGHSNWQEWTVVKGLAEEGEALSLLVETSTPSSGKSGDSAAYLLMRDGDREVRVLWKRMEPAGKEMTVLVHPERADWNAIAVEGASAKEIAEARGTLSKLFTMSAVALALAIYAAMSLRKAVVEAVSGEEEA